MEYRHTQQGTIIIIAFIIVILLIVMPYITSGVFQAIPTGILVLIAIILGLFSSLTVEISNGVLLCRFGPGIIQKKIMLSTIQDAKRVKNPWYSGWGIRWYPGGYWLWNVSGYKAVELLYKDGTRFRIGTNEPDALVKAIQSNKV